MEFDLLKPENSYIFGLFQADANFFESTRNRGKISLEISERDEDIIYKIQPLIPCRTKITTRKRNTNFKDNYKSICIALHDWETRIEFKSLGLPSGKKSLLIEPPTSDYSKIDYWRGIIDGDGSLGITANNIPFLTLVTKSDKLASNYISFLNEELGIVKKSTKNKRDQCYNICVFSEDAQKLASILYYDECLAIDRKLNKCREVLMWIRPEGRVKRKLQRWQNWEEDYILKNDISSSVEKLNRTESSIYGRLQKISKE